MSNPTEQKLLYRRLENLFDTLDPTRPPRDQIVQFLEELYRQLSDELQMRGAALYHETSDGYVLQRAIGDAVGHAPEELPASLPSLKLVFEHRAYLFHDPAATAAPHLDRVLPRGPAAAIAVGDTPDRRVFFFLFDERWVWEKIDFTLNTIRVALSSRLIEHRALGSVLQAAEIQKSLLVAEPPPFPGYDIACRSVPADEVGGDFYDFTDFDGEWLGVAIGDASGHGLPAALLVRDVVTGLRMGMEKDLKVSYTFRKLNKVIHRSRLSSRFVSLFYAELEPNGNLIYVNGGHLPPLLLYPDSTVQLATGGAVIGPLPDARFKRGFVHFDRGATLLLYTDGLIERANRGDELFGVERLEALLRAHPKESASELIERMFAAVEAWGDGRPFLDDATAVVLKRHRTA